MNVAQHGDAQTRRYAYSLIVVDNFHMGDPDDADEYEVGPFSTCEAAVNHARGIIDAFASEHAAGKTAADLYKDWAQYGETPIIATNDPGCRFSGSGYARQRFEELCKVDTSND